MLGWVQPYQPSTKFYLEDEQQRQHWQTPLPFPVQVVAKVEVIDRISQGKLTTEYKYHHGYWDGAEREFRGFGRVEQLDTETFADYNQPGLHGEEAFERVEQAGHFSPPTLTKTWFHQGPVGNELGEWAEVDYGDEFWWGDPQVLQRPAAMVNFLNHLPRRAKRDALRSLRGQVLRTELYALDGTERQNRPYTVSESLSGVGAVVEREGKSQLICESPPQGWAAPEDKEQYRIFFPHALAQRTTQWERGEEPMTQFSFTADYDEYGQPCRQIDIACPRHWQSKSKEYLATDTEIQFAQRDDDPVYIVDRIATTNSYELTIPKTSSTLTVEEFKQAAMAKKLTRKAIAQTLNFYDGKAFTGLPSGQIGQYGALVRTETLILTPEIRDEAYQSAPMAGLPPYLEPDPTQRNWSADYPQAFRDSLPVKQTNDSTRPKLKMTPVGYGFTQGGANSPYLAGYFVATERQRYDFQTSGVEKRGLVTVMRDPLGRDTTIAYDEPGHPYRLLPTKVTDPVGLTTEAEYDYRVFQPEQVTDANGNRQQFCFTPLGLTASISVLGKAGEKVGDTREQPGTIFIYDFLAFDTQKLPIFVHTIKREEHRWDLIHEINQQRQQQGQPPLTDAEITALFPKDEVDRFLERFIQSREYSDGFGRVMQTRTQAEDVTFGDAVFGQQVLPANPGDLTNTQAKVTGKRRTQNAPVNVAVSGWQRYDNKGQVIVKYEPFLATGWEFQPPTEAQLGQKVRLYYDPRGQVIRTVNPNGSEERVIYGIPTQLSQPENFTPTPWEVYTYDANDNAGRTHGEAAKGYRHYWNTPASIVVDALGRTVKAIERNGQDEYVTESTYDIRGNVLTVKDALKRDAFLYCYDLTPKEEDEEGEEEGPAPLRIVQLDGGIRVGVTDAVGNAIEQRDSKGALILTAYDSLHRPVKVWARDGQGETITLRQRLIYGDSSESGLTEVEAQKDNLLGELYQHYDEAGLLTLERYDFKGNVLEQVRRVIKDEAILKVFDSPPADWQIAPFRVDWQGQGQAARLLDPKEYRTSMQYDALDRLKQVRYPEDVEQKRRVLQPTYNRAGALAQVKLDDQVYVRQIAYNAQGQRTLIAYGNDVMTRYAYDIQTGNLVRLRSERYESPTDSQLVPKGEPLQDFSYTYDLAGNILTIQERTPKSGLPAPVPGLSPNQDRLNRTFTYDPLYRLLSATGRECDTPPLPKPWDDQPKCHDITKTRAYQEDYTYDSVGNMSKLMHTAGQGSFTRDFTLLSNTNRLESMKVRGETYKYAFDVNGNMTGEGISRHFEWDHSDQMRVFRTQTTGAEPSVYAHYLYDSEGQRVMKLVRKGTNQYEVTVYIGDLFEHHRIGQTSGTQDNNTLHVMDDTARIAMVRVGPAFSGDRSPSIKYCLGDHLASAWEAPHSMRDA